MTDAAQDNTGSTTGTVSPTNRWRLRRRTETDPERPDYAVVRRLILGSALMLFLELALIRWLGANVVHLSYFSNFVLLGSFLGIGLGFLIACKRWSILPAAPVILAALVILIFRAGHHRRAGNDASFTSPRCTPPARPPGPCCRSSSCWWPRAWPGRRGGRPPLRRLAPAHRLPLGPWSAR
ncbi:MAG: hypothetical protein U0R72_11785 [Nakamurella multipartita]